MVSPVTRLLSFILACYLYIIYNICFKFFKLMKIDLFSLSLTLLTSLTTLDIYMYRLDALIFKYVVYVLYQQHHHVSYKL